MDDQIKNVEESFLIIKKMIESEKVRFNENGFAFLFWGWLAIFAALLQYLLIFLDVKHAYFAWFVMPLGGIFMGFYYRNKKGSSSMPLTGSVLAYTWIFIGLNIFAVAFLFSSTIGSLLMFFILVMIGIGAIISGALLRFSWLIFGGIICNILAYTSIFVPHIYWGAISILAVIFANLIPGYMLRIKYRNQNV